MSAGRDISGGCGNGDSGGKGDGSSDGCSKCNVPAATTAVAALMATASIEGICIVDAGLGAITTSKTAVKAAVR